VRVVYSVCCGVDVHKTFLVATIITTTKEGTVTYLKDRFSTFNKSLIKMRDWLLANNCFDVCMESTGKYYIPVYNILEEAGFHVTVANPKWVAVIKGNKDDVKDSKWIGELFRLGLVPGSFIPPKPIRILREYTRYRYKLVCCKSSEKNRYQNAFTVCNIALDAVVSDMFGKSASAILDYIVNGESFDPKHCVTFLHKKMLKKADQVVESVEGFQMTEEQKQRIRFILSHYNFVEALIGQMDHKIDEMVAPYENAISLLCTIPGISRRSAITVLSEIGTDMSQFVSSDKLSAWAGLAPSNNQSAGKKKSVKISRAGVYLKPALVEVAHAAVKDAGSSYYKVKFERISKRRGKKRAAIAVARMILVAVYHMLLTGEAWNPSDLARVDMPQELHERQQKQAIKQAVNFLIKQGVVLPENIRLPAA
jgi:transposase